MKQDKQENNDERSLVVCNTYNVSPLCYFTSTFSNTVGCADSWKFTTNPKAEPIDYELMNKIICL
jgi:hypothetical protein